MFHAKPVKHKRTPDKDKKEVDYDEGRVTLTMTVCLFQTLSWVNFTSDGHNRGLTDFTVCQTKCLTHFPDPFVVFFFVEAKVVKKWISLFFCTGILNSNV